MGKIKAAEGELCHLVLGKPEMHFNGNFVVPGRYQILYLGCGRLVSLGVLVTVNEPAKASARSSRPL